LYRNENGSVMYEIIDVPELWYFG